MKLSEAILAGAQLRPQATMDLFSFRGIPHHLEVLGSCAIGAACEGLGLVQISPGATGIGGLADKMQITEDLRRLYPGLHKDDFTELSPCPVCQATTVCLETAIAELNDTHLWSREQIAAWLVASGRDLESVEVFSNDQIE